MPSRGTRRSRNTRLSGPGAIAFLIFVAALFIYQSWQEGSSPAPVLTQTAPTLASGGSSPAGDALALWFTDPLAGKSSGGIEHNLISAIDAAQTSIDMAIYNLTLPDVGEALLRAKQRGLRVRLVMESEAMDKDIPQKLQAAGIPIVGDQKEGLMHNKFTLIDGQEVWMGSMNYTSTSAYKDFNNLLRLRSPQLVQDYQVNFDEMFVEHKFEGAKEANTPYPQTRAGSIPVEVYFSPDDGVAQHVTAELRKAQHNITILAYSFTSDDFANAIDDRAKAGVKVRGVFDESQAKSNKGGEFENFKQAGYDVRLDGIPGLLHDKVMIIDGQVVITGSYNFSASAEKTNDENLLILRDAAVAAQYMRHFEQVYQSGQ